MVYYKQNIRNFAYEHYCNSNDITITGDNKVQRCLNAGLEQAVLINIVAAVNDDAHDDASLDTRDNSSVVDSLSSRFTVISTLGSPRERTVSIPNSPVSLNMPTGTIGQKKPVYYKHSEFEVKKNKLTNIYGGSANNGNRLTKLNRPSVKKQTLDKPKPVLIEKIVKRIPSTTPILEERNGVKGKHDTVRKSQSTSWSPVRRLGALKKTNSRTLHETSKCDMIDIKVANDVIARNKAKTTDASTKRSRVFEKHTKTLSPPPAAKTHPFYRSKSLPVVLPVKTNKSISPQRYHARIIKNTPVTRHGKESGAYGIIRHVPTGYKLDELTLNNSFCHDPSKVIAISREVRLHTPNTTTPRLSLKHRQRWQSKGSLCNDKCSTTTATSTLYNDNFSTTDTYNSALFKDNCSMTVTSNCTELEQQQEYKTITPVNTKEPVEEVKRALNGQTSSDEQLVSEEHNADVSKGDNLKTHANLSEKQTSGILNKTASLTDAFSERKSEKRVQFAGNHTRCTSDNGGGDTNRISPNITGYGDSSMTQARAYTSRTSYSGIQPLTSQELLRLKQKYIPTNVRNSLENHTSLNFTNTSAMKIQGFSRPASELSGRTVSFSVSDSEDNDSVGDIEGSIDDVDISTSYSDDEDTESESEDEETDDDVTVIPDETNKTTENPPPRKKRAKYKFVKAVDLDSYTGFEHKKLRNVYKGPFVSRSSDDPLGNFVKVKVRDVYL